MVGVRGSKRLLVTCLHLHTLNIGIVASENLGLGCFLLLFLILDGFLFFFMVLGNWMIIYCIITFNRQLAIVPLILNLFTMRSKLSGF